MNTAAAQYRAVQRTAANDVIAQHADLVRRIAHHLAARLPASVEIDDLIQAGMIGLLEASRSYDAEQGASFETYASIRIRGSMIDEIRRGAPDASVIVDRGEAIRRTVLAAHPAEVILLAGKGHEPYQEIAGVRRPFSDVEEARAALAARKEKKQ